MKTLDIFLNDPFNIDKLSKKTSFFASVYFYVSFSLIAVTPVLFFLESTNETSFLDLSEINLFILLFLVLIYSCVFFGSKKTKLHI